MNRIIRMYIAFLVLLLVLGIIGIWLTKITGFSGALRKLGKGESDYLAARNVLLLSPNDPSNILARYIANSQHTKRARIQALSIFGSLAGQQELAPYGQEIAGVLADTSRELRMQALKTFSLMGTLNGADRIIKLFRESDDTGIVQLSHQVIRDNVLNTEISINSAMEQNDSAILDSCLHKTVLDSFLVMNLYSWAYNVGPYLANLGRLDEAEKYSNLGFITKWWLIAGWPNHDMRAFYAPLPPETVSFDSAQSWKINDTVTAHWIKIAGLDNSYGSLPVNNIEDYVQPKLYSVAYCRTFIHSPDDRKALLLIGSDDGMRVWFNDSLILSHKCFRGAVPDNDVIKIRLHKGPNKLLIKVTQDIGGWAIVCRVTALNGYGMSDLFASFDAALDTSAITRILDQMARSKISWETLSTFNIRSMHDFDPGDERLLDSFLAVFLDVTQNGQRRSNAAQALALLNSFERGIPYGEKTIIAFCDSMLLNKPRDPITRDAANMLAWFGSVRALDIGKKLRASGISALARAGNTIIGSVVKARLKNIPAKLRHDNDYMKRQLIELIALDPNDAGALLDLIQASQSIGDTTPAKELARKAAMPAQWVYFPILGKNGTKPNDLGRKSGSFSLAALQADSAKGNKPIKITETPLTAYGMHFLRIPNDPASVDGMAAFYTEIISSKDDSALICISQPDAVAFCNGEQCLAMAAAMRDSQNTPQGENLELRELGTFAAKINPGTNKIIIFMNSGSISNGSGLIRIGFKDRFGRLLTFKDNTIKWQDAQ